MKKIVINTNPAMLCDLADLPVDVEAWVVRDAAMTRASTIEEKINQKFAGLHSEAHLEGAYEKWNGGELDHYSGRIIARRDVGPEVSHYLDEMEEEYIAGIREELAWIVGGEKK